MTGLIKTYWDEIRAQVARIDKKLASLIDDVSPGKQYPLYISSYHYGEKIGDHMGTFLKNDDGEIYQLGDNNTPAEVIKDLGYGAVNAPLVMLLEKNFEWVVYDKINNISLPIYIEKPGYFVGVKNLLEKKPSETTYLSSSIMSCYAGAKSSFLLPNIGNQRNHSYIQRKLLTPSLAPKHMHEHSEIFKEIASESKEEWLAKVLLFSNKWLLSLKNDPSWVYIKQYLMEKMVIGWEQDKNKFFYDLAFSRAQVKKNITQNVFLNETAKHIIGISMGRNIGFKPVENSDSIPAELIKKVYSETYKIKQNPIILEPATFDFQIKSPAPIYYSLQRPIICSSERQNKYDARALNDIHILKSVIAKYKEAFASKHESDHYMGTSLSKMDEIIDFSFYHYQAEKNSAILPSLSIALDDRRFGGHNENLKFPSDGKFFRGCVKISKKTS